VTYEFLMLMTLTYLNKEEATQTFHAKLDRKCACLHGLCISRLLRNETHLHCL